MTAVAAEAPLDPRAVWRRIRMPVILGALVIGLAAGLAAVSTAPPERPLDPRDASPVGARALAVLLRERGVAVDTVTSVDALNPAATTTIVIADAQATSTDALRALAATRADIVILTPTPDELAALAVHAAPVGEISARTAQPACALSAAVAAGKARFGGIVYSAAPPATGCYPVDGGDFIVSQRRTSGGATTVVGSPVTFTNQDLARQGDAALAIGLLDGEPTVQWLAPVAPTASTAGTRHSIISLLPDRLLWALLQLFVVVVLVALWRARRMGPVVPEALPVVVRATETVEGRARLMRAARARASAARSMRSAARKQITTLLQLGSTPQPAALVEATATRSGQPASAVEAVLYGADPPDDAALVRLTGELDALVQTIRRS